MKISKIDANQDSLKVNAATEPTVDNCSVALDHIKLAIEALGDVARDADNDCSSLAKEAIADLSVVFFTLKG